MCGIVGLISRKTNGFIYSDMEVLRGMLTLDTLRGMDGTGVYCALSNRQVTSVKIASHPFHLFATDEWNSFQSKVIGQGRIVVGHNRKATQGSINSENAHPFIEENIILVHNGTLRGGHKSLGDREVDSHAVCHAFATRGAEAVLPEIDGAFAFVWWDTTAERLFVVRNEERPLTIVTCDDYYAIASESWMAQAMMSRSSQKVTAIDDFKPGILYSFDLKGNREERPVKLKDKWVQPIPTRYNSPAANCGMGGCGDDDMVEWWEQNGEWMNKSRTPNVIKSLSAPAAITAPTKDPQEIIIPKSNVSHIVPVGGKVPTTTIWKKDMLVNVQIFNSRIESAQSRVKVFGKIRMPGMPETDCVGFLPKVKDIVDAAEYQGMGKMVVARVTQAVLTNCGVSVWITDIHFDKEVKVHRTDLPLGQTQWDYILDNCKCSQCTAKIYEEEAEFTAVSRTKDHDFKVICADCIQEKLVPGEISEDFIKRRNAALQTGFHKREEHIASSQSGVESQSTPTIH